jgi:hypothetical protein
VSGESHDHDVIRIRGGELLEFPRIAATVGQYHTTGFVLATTGVASQIGPCVSVFRREDEQDHSI